MPNIDVSRLKITTPHPDDPEWSHIHDPQTGRSTNVPTRWLTDVFLILEGKVESLPTDAPPGGLLRAIMDMGVHLD